MLSVSFQDHSAAISAMIVRKMQAATEAVADELATQYRNALSVPAPPHSDIGEIPHAYLGHKIGGYGPVNGFLERNNQVAQGFRFNQTDYLKNYIESSFVSSAGPVGAVVGFARNHTRDRPGGLYGPGSNYLLYWDQIGGRPWVKPVFQITRNRLRSLAESAFRGTP